jgi:hypothetical protein
MPLEMLLDHLVKCLFDRFPVLHQFGNLVRMLGNSGRQHLAIILEILVTLRRELVIQHRRGSSGTAATCAHHTRSPRAAGGTDAGTGDAGFDLIQGKYRGCIDAFKLVALRLLQVMAFVECHFFPIRVHHLIAGQGPAADQGKLHAIAIVHHLCHDVFQIRYGKAIKVAIPALASSRDQCELLSKKLLDIRECDGPGSAVIRYRPPIIARANDTCFDLHHAQAAFVCR